MPEPQATPLQITTPAQAAALLDFTYGARLLEQFLSPRTASQAARALGEPANRVAYHVGKLARTGLLLADGRQGKGTLYRAAAQTFQVPRDLVRMDEPLTLIEPVMREITGAYARAVLGWQTRQDLGEPHGDTHLTVSLGVTAAAGDPAPAGPYPPAMRLRAVQLTPERYRQVQAALDQLLSELEDGPAPAPDRAQPTTFVLMSFPGHLHGP
ncbi:helix-turn-helix domain-containing protein [Deinococcus multiflagellatus]|uniref:hypothetical protein n=1 Tax=Deinococcus multiflagellatus TaxID=1656887 RepID=UPI001CCA29C4|nr:hypothetical protein [Deinococcus multiflagellatus]MBZ9712533.1 hypothetical protein [Deinococcus multiflagellatus]